MNSTGVRVLLLVLGSGLSAYPQTPAVPSATQHHASSFELRHSVVATARFDRDGRVCEMVLEKRPKTDSDSGFNRFFSKQEIDELLDELVPVPQRGRNLTPPLNVTIDGGALMTELIHENIIVRIHGFFRPAPGGDVAVVITWPGRVCGQSAER